MENCPFIDDLIRFVYFKLVIVQFASGGFHHPHGCWCLLQDFFSCGEHAEGVVLALWLFPRYPFRPRLIPRLGWSTSKIATATSMTYRWIWQLSIALLGLEAPKTHWRSLTWDALPLGFVQHLFLQTLGILSTLGNDISPKAPNQQFLPSILASEQANQFGKSQFFGELPLFLSRPQHRRTHPLPILIMDIPHYHTPNLNTFLEFSRHNSYPHSISQFEQSIHIPVVPSSFHIISQDPRMFPAKPPGIRPFWMANPIHPKK